MPFDFSSKGAFARIGDYYAPPGDNLPFSLEVDGGGAFDLVAATGKGASRTFVWRDGTDGLEVTRRMEYDAETGLFACRDALRNLRKKPVVVRKFAARFDFGCGEYELYSQESRWGAESSQGEWRVCRVGSILLQSREGRACEGATPFAALRDRYSSHALAFLVCPMGDWQLRFSCFTESGRLSRLAVETGLSSDGLALELAPDECWEAPETLMQLLPGREAHSGSHLLNRYLNRRFPHRPGHFPVVYNTWLDRMNQLDLPRMERQLKAARECGCEVFVVDYGWYEDNGCFARVDEWPECRNRAFRGKMRQFAARVRKAGLGFGFWVEMEFFHDGSRVVREHPEWFFASAHEHLVCPRIWLPEVEDYLVESLAATIRRYGAVYVKNDMNHSQGREPARLSRYQQGLLRVMTRLRAMLPEVTFENCSSGSARLAAGGMLDAFDNHFISDNAEPLQNLRMFQGMVLRFPPGRIYHWYVGAQLSAKSPSGEMSSWGPGMVLQPCLATWDWLQTEDLDFGMLCNLTGQLGFSCDLDSFSPENRRRIAEYTAFYKKYRKGLLRTEARLLTPFEPFDRNRGWLALQLTDPVEDRHFLYVFHCLRDGDLQRRFHLGGLVPARRYCVRECFPESRIVAEDTGRALERDGICVEFPFSQLMGCWRGRLLMLEPR